jgi:ribosomal protein S18 acetylase RimI-like enzyme
MTASRKPVRVRPATLDDLPFLMDLGQELKNTRGISESRLTEAVSAAINDHEKHLVLAVSGPDDAEVALGMSLFSLSSANPLFDVPAVHISHTVVSAKHRRRGAGRALMAAATSYADDLGIEQLVISVDPGSRESARFFARLGFVPLAVRRTAPVALVRRKLSPGASRLRV